MKWKTEINEVRYSVAIEGIKLEMFKDTGSPETSGSNSLLARHFLSKEKWKIHFENIFGQETYAEIYKAVEMEYTKYLDSPTAYDKKQN